MRTLNGALAAVVAIGGFATTARAQPAEPAPEIAQPAEPAPVGLVPTASFMTRYELRENYADLGASGRIAEGDGVAYRARFGLRTTAIQVEQGREVLLHFEPQASGFWADASSTLSDAALGVHTAKLRLQGAGYWFDAGRFEMAYGDHLVIGNVGWHETGRTFDGLRLHRRLGGEGAWLDAFVTQVGEGRPDAANPPGAGDTYFAGVYVGLGPLVGKGDLDVYLLGLIWPKSHSDPDPQLAEEVTVGARAVQPFGKADLRAEAGLQVGKRPGDVSAFALQGEIEVGYAVADGTRFALGGYYATGDDPNSDTDEAWNQLFPTAHKFLGFADLMGGRQNVMGGMLRAKHAAGKKVVAAADAHLFLRPQTPEDVDAYTGAELDLWSLYLLGKGLGLKGSYSLFVPNESGPFGSDMLAHYVEVQLLYTLK
jgi:hypothetical protein